MTDAHPTAEAAWNRMVELALKMILQFSPLVPPRQLVPLLAAITKAQESLDQRPLDDEDRGGVRLTPAQAAAIATVLAEGVQTVAHAVLDDARRLAELRTVLLAAAAADAKRAEARQAEDRRLDEAAL